jgi:hypothetical protein
MTPLPTRKAGGPPQHLVGELGYTENYNSTSSIGTRSSHTVESLMVLNLKIDPEQSDESKTVWVDDGGVWELKGAGQARDARCTNLNDTYSGSGTFQKWDPSVEGTGIVQVTVFNEPANQPSLLTFSVVGHIGRTDTAGSAPGGGCMPFNADNWWPFPTSMAGAMLQGAVDRSGGTLHIHFILGPDPNKPGAFEDVAYATLEGRP